jgi:hypothetical protein
VSLVYAHQCDGCGKLSAGPPKTWSGKPGSGAHYCESAECREEADTHGRLRPASLAERAQRKDGDS